MTHTPFDSAVSWLPRLGGQGKPWWWILDRMTDKPGERSSHPVMDPFSAVSLFAYIPPSARGVRPRNWPQPSCVHLTHIFNHHLYGPPFYGFISIIVPRRQSSRPWNQYNSIAAPSRWIIIALRYSNDAIAAPSMRTFDSRLMWRNRILLSFTISWNVRSIVWKIIVE